MKQRHPSLPKDDMPIMASDDVAVYVKWVNSTNCLVVDWQDDVDVAPEFAKHLIPDGAFDYDYDSRVMKMRFNGKHQQFTLREDGNDGFRSVVLLNSVLTPEYELRWFSISKGSDTPVFLIRPQEWWKEFSLNYTKECRKNFLSIKQFAKLQNL
jgi:hypothetical protein